jgi:hypothetical protein
MNLKITLLVIFLAIFVTTAFAQEKTKKQKQIEELVNSKTFVFNATKAFPKDMKPVYLTSSYMKFSPDLLESHLQYYDKANSGVRFGSEAGMKFEDKPEEFTVTKGKKNYSIYAVVKRNNETYNLSLSVSFNGTSSLSVTSNNQSFISYSGDITAPDKAEKKQ